MSGRPRTLAAFLVLLVWLGILVYDVLTPGYEMPVQLFALGVGVVSYILGINIPTMLGNKRNDGGTL